MRMEVVGRAVVGGAGRAVVVAGARVPGAGAAVQRGPWALASASSPS